MGISRHSLDQFLFVNLPLFHDTNTRILHTRKLLVYCAATPLGALFTQTFLVAMGYLYWHAFHRLVICYNSDNPGIVKMNANTEITILRLYQESCAIICPALNVIDQPQAWPLCERKGDGAAGKDCGAIPTIGERVWILLECHGINLMRKDGYLCI